MNLLLLGAGAILILLSLRSRHDPTRSLSLLAGGALLVIAAGLLTLAGLELDP